MRHVVAIVLLLALFGSCGGDDAEPARVEQARPPVASTSGTVEAEPETGVEAATPATQPGPDPHPTEATEPAPTPQPAVAAASGRQVAAAVPRGTWEVVSIVDGDTIDVRSPEGVSERVRLIGIDTPERGECGFIEAAEALATLVAGEGVHLPGGARDDRDRHGRILRYVDVHGTDAGRELIASGLATARYDSRDGYGRHPREADYVAVDAASPAHLCAAPAPAPVAAPAPAPVSAPAAGGPGTGPGGAWRNCTEARDAGAAPVHRGDPGYGRHLDRDDDGIGCE